MHFLGSGSPVIGSQGEYPGFSIEGVGSQPAQKHTGQQSGY